MTSLRHIRTNYKRSLNSKLKKTNSYFYLEASASLLMMYGCFINKKKPRLVIFSYIFKQMKFSKM